MDALDKARIGKTELTVTRLGQGGAAIGGLFTNVTEEDAGSTSPTGRSSAHSPLGGVRATVLSTKFSSSRTFPGQS